MKSLATISMFFLLTSCASVLKGTDQSMTFTSEPVGAEVLLDGQSLGVTPLVVKLKKNKYDTVMIKLKGYKVLTRPVDKSYDGIALLNISWDSSTTDMITGAAYEYSPNTLFFNLEPELVVQK